MFYAHSVSYKLTNIMWLQCCVGKLEHTPFNFIRMKPKIKLLKREGKSNFEGCRVQGATGCRCGGQKSTLIHFHHWLLLCAATEALQIKPATNISSKIKYQQNGQYFEKVSVVRNILCRLSRVDPFEALVRDLPMDEAKTFHKFGRSPKITSNL